MPEPNKRQINLTKLLVDVILLFEVSLSKSKIKITFVNEIGNVNAFVDETMINQAITNLIKNAGEAIVSKISTSFSESFKPEIRVYLSSFGSGIEISIQDNGIGFPNKQRSRLFEPYVTSRENGTGLGLSIVKKIIEEHNGTLELLDADRFSSDKHFGAKLRIKLPQSVTNIIK